MSTITMTKTQPVLDGPLLELAKLIQPAEVLAVDSPDYLQNTQPWSTGKDKKPRLVLRPRSVESLSKIVTFLYDTDLDYAVRTTGFGSASAADVLISMSFLDDFEFNQDEEYVILGAGNTWGACYEKLAAVAPEWSVVGGRTPGVGVGGSILSGGFSWLSSQYGCGSDPSNLLDVHIVTADGQMKWASSDPDLLWALRGTGPGFAIATRFKLRARKLSYWNKMWSGAILIPRTAKQEVAQGIVSMIEKEKSGVLGGKTAMFCFMMQKEILKFLGVEQDVISVTAFDARGEDAGRKEFEWALKIDGAIDMTKGNLTMQEVVAGQAHAGGLQGKGVVFWTGVCLDNETETTKEVLAKSFDWWVSTLDQPGSLSDFGFLILEFFATRDNLTGRSSSAWPRPEGFKYQMLIGTGCAPDSDEATVEAAKQLMLQSTKTIVGKSMDEIDAIPNVPEEYNNVEKIYGDHFRRLREIKTRVDPKDRLHGVIRPL